jgi:hypothetical protein
MILLAAFTRDSLTAVNGSVEQITGQTEKEIVGIVAPDPYLALALALTDCKTIKSRALKIYTNDAALLKFLTPPISIKPTKFKDLKGWGRVGWGGDENQWGILYGLAVYNWWSIHEAKKLPGTEALHDEYRASDYYEGKSGTGLPVCARRLYAGVWAGA